MCYLKDTVLIQAHSLIKCSAEASIYNKTYCNKVKDDLSNKVPVPPQQFLSTVYNWPEIIIKFVLS